MNMRLRRARLTNVGAGLVAGIVLAATAGCSDDDAPIDFIPIDGGTTSETTGSTETVETTDGNTSTGSEGTGTGTPTDTQTIDVTGGDTASSDESSDTSVATTGTTSESTAATGNTASTSGTEDTATDVATTGPVLTSSDDITSSGPVDSTTGGIIDTSGEDTGVVVPDLGTTNPPGGASVVTSYNLGDDTGFEASPTVSGVNLTVANSVMYVEVPYTHGNQETGVNFIVNANLCGYELVARVKLVSGFNADASQPGGVQLRAWSGGWSGVFTSKWTTVSAVGDVNQLDQWVEYHFDLDTETADNFDVTNVTALGVAFIAGGPTEAVYTDTTFLIDWLALEPKDGGCPGDTGSTIDTGGTIDTGETVDTGGTIDTGETLGLDAGVVDTTGPVDTSGGEASTGGPVTDVDASVPDTSGPNTTGPETSGPADVDASVPDTSSPVDTSSAPASSSAAPESSSSAPESSSAAPESSSSAPESSSAAPGYGPNIHSNSGFESDTGWWYLTGSGAIAQSADFAHSGTYSLLNSGRTVDWNGAGTNLIQNGFLTQPLIQGETYLFQAWVRLSGLPSATVALSSTITCDGTTTQPWLANGTANDTGWSLISGEFAVPTCPGSGLTAFTLIVNHPDPVANIYLDDFSIQQVLN